MLRRLEKKDAPLMLEWMHEGKHQLTKDNYQDYLDTIRSYYQSYDYESLEEQRQLSGAGA